MTATPHYPQPFPETLPRHRALLAATPQLVAAFEALPDPLVVLDPERQILFSNAAFADLAGASGPAALRGLRPGEALSCVRVFQSGGRCGTTEHCRVCGLLDAVGASLRGEAQTRECRILRVSSGALDLRVRATPFRLEEEEFTLVVLQDIADEKRRAALERIFFHDVLNTAATIRGLAGLMGRAASEELPRYWKLLDEASLELVRQIQAQRELSAAEAGDLMVNREPVDPGELLRQACSLHEPAVPIRAEVPPNPPPLRTDRVLLQRVLGNMIKNAAEAAAPGETVRAGVAVEGENLVFWVRNRAVMDQEVRLQVFQRSFSTKGSGRGLGTYSMQLLAERYLGGSVDFTSSEEGTTFRARFPLR